MSRDHVDGVPRSMGIFASMSRDAQLRLLKRLLAEEKALAAKSEGINAERAELEEQLAFVDAEIAKHVR